MKVWPEDLLEYEHNYKMEIHFPGMSKLVGVGVYFKTLTLLDNYDIGANWTYTEDSWILNNYHLKASGRTLTHGQMFNNCIKPAYDGAMWIDAFDMGERESLFPPDIPLPESLKEWKGLLGIAIVILMLLVILPYAYRKGR